jgi:TetR/AcrR family transcriptional regulator
MTELKEETEQRIIDAANKVFLDKGLEGARMQEIADEAKISKALLHYYFRTKERLFDAILRNVLQYIFPKVNVIIEENIPAEELIRRFVHLYVETLSRHPFVPLFVLREMHRDPTGIFKVMDELNISGMSKKFNELMVREISKGNFRKVDPHHVIVNIVALSMFPIIAAPTVKHLIYNENEEEYEKFKQERADAIIDFVLNSLRP